MSNCSHSGRSKYLYNEDGKVIGKIAGDTFERRARSSRQMLKKPRGWAFDVRVLKEMGSIGICHIIVFDIEANSTYRTTLKTFKLHGKPFNYGRGDQVCLPLDYWSIDGNPPKKTNIIQLKLFPDDDIATA